MPFQSASVAFLLWACAIPVVVSLVHVSSSQSSRSRAMMQPNVVAKLLSQVESNWGDDALRGMRGEMANTTAMDKMTASCMKVTKSVTAGSSGDKDRVVEYMHEVCEEDKVGTLDRLMCERFATALQNFLTDDDFTNRETEDFGPFCANFYKGAISDQAALVKQEEDKESAAKAKVVAEARAKQEKVDNAKREVEEKATKDKQDKENVAQRAVEAKAALDRREKAAVELKRRTEQKLEKEQKEKARQEAEERQQIDAAEEEAKEAADLAAVKRRHADEKKHQAAQRAEANAKKKVVKAPRMLNASH